jgi:hypothetical protein
MRVRYNILLFIIFILFHRSCRLQSNPIESADLDISLLEGIIDISCPEIWQFPQKLVRFCSVAVFLRVRAINRLTKYHYIQSKIY